MRKISLLTCFFIFGIKYAPCRLRLFNSYERLKKLSTVLLKLLLFAHFKILAFSSALSQSQKCSIFFFLFCLSSETSKAGKARNA